MDTELLDKAIVFAVAAHRGQERKGHGFPYVVHPLEAVSIAASITNDQEILAAAALHDVVEDCKVSHQEIEREFGPRVAKLVFDESEAPVEGNEEETWHARKQAAIDRLAAASRSSKIVALGDKLSNMRAIARDYLDQGDSFWSVFHTSDPSEHAWHYRGLAESLAELADTYAYREFVELIDKVFGEASEGLFLEEGPFDTISAHGCIDLDGAKRILGLMAEPVTYTLDFAHVEDIRLSAIHCLYYARTGGKSFVIANCPPSVAHVFYACGASKEISIVEASEDYPIETARKFGEGFASEVYLGRDNDTVIKLNRENIPGFIAQQEKRFATAALQMGISTPLAGSLVKVGDRSGVVFERLQGKRSISRLIADEPERIGEYMALFAREVRKLHSTPCDTAVFPRQATRIGESLERTGLLTEAQKGKVLAVLGAAEPEAVCCHGDLHLGNLVVSGNKAFFIDLSDFSYGNHLVDLGAFYYGSHFITDEMSMDLFHLNGKAMLECWTIFAREYFGAATPKELREIDEQMQPYAGLQACLWLKNNRETEELLGVIHRMILDK